MFAELLHEQRQRLGIQITDLAHSVGVKASRLSDFEHDRRRPGVEVLLNLVEQLSCPTDMWLPLYLEDEQRCHTIICLSESLLKRGSVDAAYMAGRQATRLSRVSYDNRYAGETYRLMGRICYEQHRYGRAVVWFRRLEAASSRRASAATRAIALYDYALSLTKIGDRSQAVAYFDESCRAFLRVPDREKAGYALLNRATLLLDINSYREALQDYRKALPYLRGSQWAFDAALGEAIAYAGTRSVNLALPKFRALLNSASHPMEQVKVLYNIAVTHRRLGQYEDARRYLEMAIAKCQDLPAGAVAALYAELCLVAMHSGDQSEATNLLSVYKSLVGQSDNQDVVAMRVLALMLGLEVPVEEIHGSLSDGYEFRIRAALDICLGTRQ